MILDDQITAPAWKNIPGWSADILPFYELLATKLPHGGVFVEVGVLFGRSLACMGTLRPDLEIYAVDTWENGERGEHQAYQDKYGTTWDAFCGGMREHAPEVWQRVHVIRARSTSVKVPLADAVFIDADHEYTGVRDDIEWWRERCRAVGVICGHDYGDHFPGVKRAVDEAFDGAHTMGPGAWTSVWVAP